MPLKGLFHMRNIILLSLLVLTLSVTADMNDCAKINNQDEKYMCMAGYSGSGLFCDRIKNFELRTHCTRIVIEKQRQMQYGIKNNKKEGE